MSPVVTEVFEGEGRGIVAVLELQATTWWSAPIMALHTEKNRKRNNKSQTHRGRQKMKSQCASEKEGWRGIQRERQREENEWPISIKVAMLLKVGAGQLKVNSRRMDRTDWIYRSCFLRSMPHTHTR